MEAMAGAGPLEACVGGTHPCSRWLNKNSKRRTPGHPGDQRISSRSQEPPSQSLPVSTPACQGPVHCCGCLASCVWEQTPGRAAKVSGDLKLTTHTLLTTFQVCSLKHLVRKCSFSRMFQPTGPGRLQDRRALWTLIQTCSKSRPCCGDSSCVSSASPLYLTGSGCFAKGVTGLHIMPCFIRKE